MIEESTRSTVRKTDPVPDGNPSECTCYTDCNEDSHSGRLHQHEDDPCPIHDESVSPIVG